MLDTDSWAFLNTSIKLYPSCRYSHPYVKSALVLRDKFRLDQINKMTIGVNETAAMLCHPLKERCQPQTLQDAKFSIPFMVSFAFVHGAVGLHNLTEAALKDSKVLNLAKCLVIEQTQSDSPGLPQGDISVVTDTGEHKHIEHLHPDVSSEAVKEKFITCCQYSGIANPWGLWEMLDNHLGYDVLDNLQLATHKASNQ